MAFAWTTTSFRWAFPGVTDRVTARTGRGVLTNAPFFIANATTISSDWLRFFTVGGVFFRWGVIAPWNEGSKTTGVII